MNNLFLCSSVDVNISTVCLCQISPTTDVHSDCSTLFTFYSKNFSVNLPCSLMVIIRYCWSKPVVRRTNGQCRYNIVWISPVDVSRGPRFLDWPSFVVKTEPNLWNSSYFSCPNSYIIKLCDASLRMIHLKMFVKRVWYNSALKSLTVSYYSYCTMLSQISRDWQARSCHKMVMSFFFYSVLI
jgi:hypothetical protein